MLVCVVGRCDPGGEETNTEILVDGFRVMSVVGRFVSAGGRCVYRVGPATFTFLRDAISTMVLFQGNYQGSAIPQWFHCSASGLVADWNPWDLTASCRRNNAIESVVGAVQGERPPAGSEALCMVSVVVNALLNIEARAALVAEEGGS